MFGLPGLEPFEKELVRTGTLLAARAAEGIRAQKLAGCPWILENPPETQGSPSLFRIPAVASCLTPETHRYVFPQCAMGAAATKPTEFRTDFEWYDVPPGTCQHQRTTWRLLPDGHRLRCSHPTPKGTAVSEKAWGSMSEAEKVRPQLQFSTKQAAAYPPLLNCYLACMLIPEAVSRRGNKVLVRAGRWRNVLVRPHTCVQPPRDLGQRFNGSLAAAEGRGASTHAVDWAAAKRKPLMVNPLRPQVGQAKEQENNKAIGGMRNPQVSVAKLPSLVRSGSKVRALLELALEQSPALQRACLGAIGTDGPGPSEQELLAVRRGLACLFGVTDIAPVSKGDFSTEIRVGLLEGWRSFAGDPDWAVTKWLGETGVPAGLRLHPEDCGIFPRTEEESWGDPEGMHMDMPQFKPYEAVEDDDDAWLEVQRLESNGWLRSFGSYEELCDYLKEAPVLSKFGLIVKTRANKIKKRLILDSKSSGISRVATKHERVVLPRMLDVALDTLHLMEQHEDVEFMVLDFLMHSGSSLCPRANADGSSAACAAAISFSCAMPKALVTHRAVGVESRHLWAV